MRPYTTRKRVLGFLESGKRPGCRFLLPLFLLAGAMSLAGVESVRRVDFSHCPPNNDLAERARKLGDEEYPRVLALLADGAAKLPAQFDIRFNKEIKAPVSDGSAYVLGYVGGRKGTVIVLNAEWFAEHPTNLDAILVHEMAHVAQRYSSAAPDYWREGMADYVCYKLAYAGGPKCAECSNLSWHYRLGYSCAAAFLLYVEANCGDNVIRELNSRLRDRSYTDTFFAKATGRSLDELWEEFRKTPAFTPAAANANKFFESLGYVNGVPPKAGDLLARIRLQPGGELTWEAGKFLYGLARKQQLLGFRKVDAGNVVFAPTLSQEPASDVYPVSRSFDSSVQGDFSVYHYLAVRDSPRSAWRLQRAWRTDRDGQVIEEYPVLLRTE